MSIQAVSWRTYPEVRRILEQLLSRVQALLHDEFRGLYLSGSLAGGDFNPHTSDIDFVVVTQHALATDQLSGLNAMHQQFLASGSRWAAELEGSYLPAPAIRRHQRPPGAHPHLERGCGRLRVEPHDSDWVIHRYVLRRQGVVLAGPPPAQLIDPITTAELKQAVVDLLLGWWQPMLNEPSRLQHLGYRYYAIQTMCRALYTLQFGTVVSKPVAARWASAEPTDRWALLIAESLAWPRRESPASLDATLQFMRYTLDYCRSGRWMDL